LQLLEAFVHFAWGALATLPGVMNSSPQARIGISLGDIETLDHGLGEFAAQLGRRFATAAPEWLERYRLGFDFHLRDNLVGLFGDGVGYLPVQRSHRKVHNTPERYVLWHSLHQLNKTLAPTDCKPRVQTVHDLNYLHGKNAFSAWRHQRHVQALLKRSDTVVTISRHTSDDLRKTLHWNGPLHVILNGAHSLVGQPQRPLAGWPADERQAPIRPFLLHLSRMSASKNPKAIIALAKAWPEMQFVLCGPSCDDAKALRSRTKLPNVEFHLGIDEAQKAWAYDHCAGFLFPSLAEGFGLPPIEAMHFGKPVFLSTLTSLPEVGGKAAFYFEDFDPEGMRQVVERGLALHTHRPDVAQTIRQHAARFDWDVAADAYLALYAKLLRLPLPAAHHQTVLEPDDCDALERNAEPAVEPPG
jgi:glycosyltransferase involved in cell wall biosynthesis